MIRRFAVAALTMLAVATFGTAPAGALEAPTDVPTSGYSICVALMGVGGVCV